MLPGRWTRVQPPPAALGSRCVSAIMSDLGRSRPGLMSPRRSLMPELVLPVRHEWLARDRAHGIIAVEPFEPGFALTVGNAYRRVLLSSIPGAAPTWVKIEGVLHEFSHLPGVREDPRHHPEPPQAGFHPARRPPQAAAAEGAGR